MTPKQRIIAELENGMPTGWIDDYWHSRKEAIAIINRHLTVTEEDILAAADAMELIHDIGGSPYYCARDALKSYVGESDNKGE